MRFKNFVKRCNQKELQKADFTGDFDNSAKLIAEHKIYKNGSVILREFIPSNNELQNKFSEFIKTIPLSS